MSAFLQFPMQSKGDVGRGEEKGRSERRIEMDVCS